MTWHQWQAEYPTDNRIGTSRFCAAAKASGPHGYQSTGLSACWRRYGLDSALRRFTTGTLRALFPVRRCARRRACRPHRRHPSSAVWLRLGHGAATRRQTALVTGASRGIGRAISKALAEAGASVMLTSHKQDSLDEAAATIDGDTATFAGNAGDPDDIAACVTTTMDTFGAVDIPRQQRRDEPLHGQQHRHRPRPLRQDLAGQPARPPGVSQEAWRAWMQDNGGTIVNIASVGGLSVEHGIGIYNTTKAALIHLTKVLASDLSPGVRVNAIARPGQDRHGPRPVGAERGSDREADAAEASRRTADIATRRPVPRVALSSWMTGHTVVVDGGALISPG